MEKLIARRKDRSAELTIYTVQDPTSIFHLFPRANFSKHHHPTMQIRDLENSVRDRTLHAIARNSINI